MGFLDSFKKSFDEASQKAQERSRNSRYRTVVQRNAEINAEIFRKYNSKSDGELIRLSKAEYLSGEEITAIDRILRKRGYNKDNRGYFKGAKRL